jgi:RNA polymerase sigma-70 factor (ECF subfamily)
MQVNAFTMILDENTFKQIYDDFFEPVCRFLNGYSQDIQAIEDVVQDVFVALWEERRSCEITYVKTYLYNSARNRMLNYLRDAGNRMRILEDWTKTEEELRKATDCIDRNRFYRLLAAAVETLPDKCRAIFILHKDVCLLYREIALKQDISVKTVENQMGIAFRKIREYIIKHADQL